MKKEYGINETVICPCCRSQKVIFSRGFIFKKQILLRCLSCGLCFLWPGKLDDNDLRYSEQYYRSWSLEELGRDGLGLMKRATFSRLLDRVEKYKKKGALLDVGCAFGDLLKIAQERGWDSYGLDLSAYAINKAEEIIDRKRLFVSSFMDAPLPDASIDVITMVDVAEHLYDIHSVFRKCRRMLTGNGVLAILTPNIDSVSSKCMGRRWFHFKAEHLTYFSRRNIEKILNLNEFNLLEVASFKKAINFYYFHAQVKSYWKGIPASLADICGGSLPPFLKKINFFLPQGEMLVLARPK